MTVEMDDPHFFHGWIIGVNGWLKSIAHNLLNTGMKTYKIGSHQVLPFGKVSPIKMR
jgi:hypothetical protein